MNGCEVYHLDEDGEIVPNAIFAKDEIVLLAEKNGDSWCIEPSLEREPQDAPASNNVQVDLEDALEMSEKTTSNVFAGRKLLFWELYVDHGNLSKYMAEKYPDVQVSNFSLPDWDFSKEEVRACFLRLMEQEKPHFIWMAPPCTLWSTMQNLNALDSSSKKRLQQLRDLEEKQHLKHCKDVHDKAEEIVADTGIENPDRAASWKTETWDSMENFYDATCDRCRTGLAYYENGVFKGKVKKSTRIRTGSVELADALSLQCECPPGSHVQMVGKSTALKDMQNYELGFVSIAAPVIYNLMEDNWRKRQISQIMVTDEVDETEKELEKKKQSSTHRLTEHDRRLSKEFGPTAFNVVKKFHRQLGYPGNDRLVRALRDAKFDDSVVQCGRQFRCNICESFAPRKLDRPTSLPQTTHFNDLLEMDTFHLKWRGEKVKVLAMMDLHTRYEINEVLGREILEEEVAVLEKWMQWAGAPCRIRTDSSGAHMGEEMQAWCDEFGIKLILVPKDSHNRMGTVERLHAVRRRQLMKMMHENESLDVKKAVIIACSQRNRLRSIHGISPAAMVLGYTPEDYGISDEPTRLRVQGRQAHMEDQAVRALATKAFYEANTDATLRQVMLAKTGQMTVRWLWAIMPTTGVSTWTKSSHVGEVQLWCAQLSSTPMADQKPTGWRMAQL